MSSCHKIIKILVVDDHPIVRQGLIQVLDGQPDMTVVGAAGDGITALEQARLTKPDLILMDIKMPRCDGIKATRLILKEIPQTKIVIFTVLDDDQSMFRAIEAGAWGYLLKELQPAALLDMIRGVFRGEAPISQMTAARIMHEYARRANSKSPPQHCLTEQELEILQLVANGMSNKKIAQTLGLTLYAVKQHINSILHKLRLKNRIQAAVFAARQGLLDINK